MQGRAADAERLCRRRDIAVRARQRPLQHAALGVVEIAGRCCRPADEIGDRQRPRPGTLRNPKRLPGRARSRRRPDRRASTRPAARRSLFASPAPAGCERLGRQGGSSRPRSGAPRRLTASAIRPAKRLGQVGPARRDVECGREVPLMVEDRRGGAAEICVAAYGNAGRGGWSASAARRSKVPMPLVPSLSSFQTVPSHKPQARERARRRRRAAPVDRHTVRSASSTQQPTPPTA